MFNSEGERFSFLHLFMSVHTDGLFYSTDYFIQPITIATYFDVKLPILASQIPLQAIYYVLLTSLLSMSIKLLFSTKILCKIIQKRM